MIYSPHQKVEVDVIYSPHSKKVELHVKYGPHSKRWSYTHDVGYRYVLGHLHYKTTLNSTVVADNDVGHKGKWMDGDRQLIFLQLV